MSMNQIDFISKALITLYDNDWETCTSSIDDITWKDGHTTTDAEKTNIQTEALRLQLEYDNKEYQRKRVIEYPSIGDQLDALFHAGVFPEEMAAQIQAVKDKYPKA